MIMVTQQARLKIKFEIRRCSSNNGKHSPESTLNKLVYNTNSSQSFYVLMGGEKNKLTAPQDESLPEQRKDQSTSRGHAGMITLAFEHWGGLHGKGHDVLASCLD